MTIGRVARRWSFLLLCGATLGSSPPADDAERLRELHRKVMEAHRQGNVSMLIADESADNIVVSRSGDIFVGEDGGDLEVVMITPDRVVAPVVKLVGHDASEITGPAFSPDGSRLYFSSQRGKGATGAGVTFEVSGPFRTRRR